MKELVWAWGGVKYGKGDLKILSWYLVVFCNWWFLSWSTNTTLRTPFTAMECRYSWKSTWNYPGFLIAMTFCMSDSFHSFIISYGVLVTSVMEIACGMSFTLIDLSRSSWQVLPAFDFMWQPVVSLSHIRQMTRHIPQDQGCFVTVIKWLLDCWC